MQNMNINKRLYGIEIVGVIAIPLVSIEGICASTLLAPKTSLAVCCKIRLIPHVARILSIGLLYKCRIINLSNIQPTKAASEKASMNESIKELHESFLITYIPMI